MSAFVLNVVRDRRSCVGSVTTRRIIHLASCKWAGRARHSLRISLAEAQRISGPFSGPDGRTKLCKICTPHRLLKPSEYPSNPACICPHWRTLYGCPVHGAAIRALENLSFTRQTGVR
jgi:hypothetical protein